MFPKPKPSPLVVVLGETASGKSALALKLAKKLKGEIICADSWTVRQGVNIGTDKPSPKVQSEIPHHLIDIVEPCEDFTAAVFKDLANKSIDEINSRQRLPILVGGSGLYIDSVLFDYQFLPAGDPKLRRELNLLTIEELLKKIGELNLSLKDVDQRNKRRLIRLIESRGAEQRKGGLRPNSVIIGLRLPKEELFGAIVTRVDQMIAQGLEEEVDMLATKYGWECEALKGVGYKQWKGYFEGTQSLNETKLQIISATNNLAKKQRTWFKRNKSIHWFTQPVKIDEIVELTTTQLSI